MFHYVRRFVFGAPRQLEDRRLLQRITLVPLLAWVGLGADGLSSSAYGPEEAFRALGQHSYLAIPLAVLTATTVLVLCACYGRIIEVFPNGGGGYVVASALVGKWPGLIAGSALVVDYVLTIAVSMAAAGSALFSFLPPDWHDHRLTSELVLVAALIVANIRGVRESILGLMPIFVLFALTHAVLIAAAIAQPADHWTDVARSMQQGLDSGLKSAGVGGLLLILIHAFSLGGGTYTGIEAVSNGLSVMREPRVRTAKRTMLYMGVSLAAVSTGLLLCYLFHGVAPQQGKTMNAVLAGQVLHDGPLGSAVAVLTLLSEGALLVVAAQAGFIGGPRVLANLAMDHWAPRSFGVLSERLTARNGILLIGGASFAALVYTGGNVRHLVVMYSINVFLAFSLSLLGMIGWTWKRRRTPQGTIRRLLLFGAGLALSVLILLIMVFEKFWEGAWLTLIVTGVVVLLCFVVHRHYDAVGRRLEILKREMKAHVPTPVALRRPLESGAPTAGILVAEFDGLGLHTMLNVQSAFQGHFRNFVFLSVGVLDSAQFKGEGAVDALIKRTRSMLDRYVNTANAFGVPAEARFTVGTDVVDAAEGLCLKAAEEIPKMTFFAGKLVFSQVGWLERVFHNETAFAIQRRLQWAGRHMVILPVRVR